jgi:hypothetical protein
VGDVTRSSRETLRHFDRTDDDEDVHRRERSGRERDKGPATMPPGPRTSVRWDYLDIHALS